MLRAIPRHWYSWDFAVVDGSRHVADIDVSTWREKGELVVEHRSYEVYREGLMSGAFVLAAAGTVLARAEKPSAFTRTFVVEHARRQYVLRARSLFSRGFALCEGDRVVGLLSPEGLFSRRLSADLPDELPLPVKCFVIWLAVIIWKRAANSGD